MKFLKYIGLSIVILCMSVSVSYADPFFGLVDWADDEGVGLFEEDQTGYWLYPGVGGQSFDVEYLALKNTGDQLYFALQTGFALDSTVASGNDIFGPGDLALDMLGDETYEYALDFARFNTVDNSVNYDGTYDLIAVDTWQSAYYTQHAEADPFTVSEGTVLDSFDTIDLTTVADGQGDHYILSGSLDFNDSFAGDSFPCVGMSWTMECGNDFGRTSACPVVPEPAMLTLIGTGLCGLLAKRKFF